jgi:hypothetical protein
VLPHDLETCLGNNGVGGAKAAAIEKRAWVEKAALGGQEFSFATANDCSPGPASLEALKARMSYKKTHC